MSIRTAFLLGTLIAGLGSTGPAPGGEALRAKVLVIPAIQSVVEAEPTEGGGIIGRTTGGEVTATFPDGVVLLRAGDDFSDGALGDAIRAAVPFACGRAFPVSVKSSAECVFEPGSSPGGMPLQEGIVWDFEYRLRVHLLDAGAPASVFLEVERSPDGPGKTLLDMRVDVPASGTLLIGVPDRSTETRGNVFFVAIRRAG